MSPPRVSLRDDVRNNTELLRSVRADFFARGVTVQDWAREHGFKPRLVYSILRGERRCARGLSHQIAIELGLKKSGHALGDVGKSKRSHRLNRKGK